MQSGLLVIEDLVKEFGATRAIDELSIEITQGEVTSIIGPNGAGKTTLFNLLTGEFKPTQGAVWFDGERIDDRPPYEIVRRGIARSFQINNFFPDLTVFENVLIATQSADTGFRVADLLGRRDADSDAAQKAREVLARVGMTDYVDSQASQLSHGQQRHLEIALALALEPQLLLLDEPTAGMSPDTTSRTKELLTDLATDYTIVIVEHDMDVVMEVSDRIVVINHGSVLAVGSQEEVRQNEEVQNVYLGGTVT